jgi:two-component sensor histidine kinase
MTPRVSYWQVFKAVVVFQVLTSFLYSAQSYWLVPREVPLWRLVLHYAAINLFWAVVSPLILWLVYRFPIQRARFVFNILIHMVAASVLSFAAFAHQALIDHYFGVFPAMVRGGLLNEYRHLVIQYFIGGQHAVPQVSPGILIYLAILGGVHAFDYYQKYRDRELQASRLREQLAQSQLQALRAQLQPHFLFNTLNSIVGLIRNNENKAAVDMTTRLSELLRQVLAYSDKQEAPLGEEMEVTRRYLAIQQMRFSDRLKIEISLDPETLDARVPSLILQPLVENALLHGVARRAAEATVTVRSERRNGMLAIEVYNDGPHLPESWRMEACTGFGLANIRARLEQHYPKRHTFTLTNKGKDGVAANLTIPFSPG